MKVTSHLWALVFVIVKASGCLSTGPIGTLLPRDSNYLIGSDVHLSCILNQTTLSGKTSSFNSSFLTFKFGNQPLNSEITLKSDREAEAVIRNGQAKDSGRYYCNLEVEQKSYTVCPTDIMFGYPPKEATNFRCRSYSWENLTCTWTAPRNTAPIKYSLYYRASHMDKVFNNLCPIKLNASACTWTRSSDSIYMPIVANITLDLIGTNGIGQDTTQVFTMDHWTVVIPGEVQDLKIAHKSATELFVTWQYPKNMKPFLPGVCYRVNYKASYQENYMVLHTGVNEMNATLSQLTPNQWYTVQVQARSCIANVDVEPDLWGNVSTVADKTKMDIPWTSPPSHKSLFEVANSNFSRTVTVYWKVLSPVERNGDNFHYEVSIVQTFLNRRRRDTREVPRTNVTRNYEIFRNLDMESAYLVRIWSVNNMGSSPNFTTIVIPKRSRMPPRPLHIRSVSEGGGKFHVSWKPSAETVGGYTLVWCQGGQRCVYDINWMLVNATTNSVVLSLEDNKNYGIGVSALSSEDERSSGLEWAPCTAYSNRVLDRVTAIKADSVKSHSISVSWKLACDAQKAIVHRYEVSLCKNTCHSCEKKYRNCTEEQVKVLNNPEADSVEFENLSPYSCYSFGVVAHSAIGGSSETFLDCVRTLVDAPSDPPRLLHYSNVTNSSVQLTWTPPVSPNGVVDHYTIRFTEITTRSKHRPENISKNVPVDPENIRTEYEDLFHGLKCFTDYSVTLTACVDTLCSSSSDPVYFKTKIGVPGIMDPPWTEFVNDSHVRVLWKAPEHPNGPVDHYLLHLFQRDADNLTKQVNVTGYKTSIVLPRDCSPEVRTTGDGMHVFSIQALNYLPGRGYLAGPLSNTSVTKLCVMSPDLDTALVVGIAVGSAIALAIVIMSLYFVLRWMKYKVNKMKNIKVILPDGLQQPYSHSYEHFKKGLSSQGSETNLSPKLGYGRMDTFNGDNNSNGSFKNRHGSGTSHFSANSTDELINKPNPGGNVTSPKGMSGTGQKTTNRGDHNPCDDNSSCQDSISSSLTHHTNLSSDRGSCIDESNFKGKDKQSGRGSRLDDDENKSDGAVAGCSSLTNSHYLPATPYSKIGFFDGGRHGDYLPLARGRHLSLYGHNLANSEPSITDLSPDSYTYEPYFQQDPPSPDVPYSKFGMSHSVTDLILEGTESPDSPLSPNPSPHEALPYSRFGLRRLPPQNQGNPYVTMGMALVVGPQRDPNQLLASKVGGAAPFILKAPLKKKNSVGQVEMSSPSDAAYSKLGIADQEDPSKCHPYLTMKEIKEHEQNHTLPDLTITGREDSPSRHTLECKGTLESGYLPHQLIPAVVKEPEHALPDLVHCSSTSALPVDSEATPGVKVQEGSGYVSLNQVLGSNPNV